MTDDLSLTIERTYEAPIERVFDAWTNAEVMRRWWQAELNWSTSEAEVDVRVGGAIRVVMYDPVKEASHGGGGIYSEIERPNRLAFSWVWDWEDRETLIEIDFEQAGDSTKVTFSHSGLATQEIVQDHTYGWSNILDSLGRFVEAER